MKKRSVLALVLAFVLAGCSSADIETQLSSENNKNGDVSIEDIDWNIEEQIRDNDRFVLMDFKEKKDVKEEVKTSLLEQIQQDVGLSDEQMEQFYDRPLEMYAKSEKIVNPEESVTGQNCYYYQGYVYLKNPDLYELMEPDIATIQYLKDDEIYTEYYDFHKKKYSLEEKTEEADYWTDSELGKLITRPKDKIVRSDLDMENAFSFKIEGSSQEDFESCVEDCIGKGFTVDSLRSDMNYSANNEDGNDLYISYDADQEVIDVNISSPQ
ncbi:hypothetical protein HF861_03035 [Faecalicoccus pleomorphus]|uniref:DUF6591 domain-containing protein n=1 Tax=Faecalicoccus pleomorphus TaxID=1323 RepID=A0A7X9NGJ3_9FIRM|nr:DUF6591 domain-containing protein [Faecalicoccus pleomorphus]NME43857.1 hypothetical protein [Faecalicoccus pleomorphus]